jgi:hypothetical protein
MKNNRFKSTIECHTLLTPREKQTLIERQALSSRKVFLTACIGIFVSSALIYIGMES